MALALVAWEIDWLEKPVLLVAVARSRTGLAMVLAWLVLPSRLQTITERAANVTREAYLRETRHRVFACQATSLLPALAVLSVPSASSRTTQPTPTASPAALWCLVRRQPAKGQRTALFASAWETPTCRQEDALLVLLAAAPTQTTQAASATAKERASTLTEENACACQAMASMATTVLSASWASSRTTQPTQCATAATM